MDYTWLKEAIDESRTVKPSTRDSYVATLKNIYKNLYGTGDFEDLDWLLEHDDVVNIGIDENRNGGANSLSTKKTRLAAISVAFQAFPDKYTTEQAEPYVVLMKNYQSQFDNNDKLQIKSETQQENWVPMNKIKKVLSSYENYMQTHNLYQKDTATKSEMKMMKKWLIANLYMGCSSHPPVRANYNMKVIERKQYDTLLESDKMADNFLVNVGRNKKYFSFGNYKTNKHYGIQLIKLSPKINKIVNTWQKYNKSPFLIPNQNGENTSTNGLANLVTQAFEPTGKQLGVNMLRHIFISTAREGDTAYNEKADLAKLMHHSVSKQEFYCKHEDS